jgi:hypothetical protein
MVGSMEQMLQAAMYGQEVLDAAAQRSATEAARATATVERPVEEVEGNSGKARSVSTSVCL